MSGPKKLAPVLDITMARIDRERQQLGAMMRLAKERFGLPSEPDREPAYDPKRTVFAVGIPGEKQAEIQQRLDRHGNPVRALDHDYRLHAALEAGERTILLVGPGGAGKTLTACRWLAPHPDGRCLYAHQITDLTSYSDDRTQWNVWRGHRQMVIDEIDKVPRLAVQRLGTFILERHDRGKTTILTAQKRTLPGWLDRRVMEVECREVVDPRARKWRTDGLR